MHEPAQITVVKPGWLTTIQDLGRFGAQAYGVSVSGAMDRRSLVIGNRLVGNGDHEAALEITLQGPELQFAHNTVIALTGADLSPALNHQAVPLWTCLLVTAGSTLSCGTRRSGARCYLAVAGGLDVPIVFGSRATHVSSKTGGLNGRALIAGDVVACGKPLLHQFNLAGRSLPDPLRPAYSNPPALRIVAGPQEDAFRKDALSVITNNAYRLSSQSDRMGYRLQGPAVSLTQQTQHISDATATGALQVPHDGQPILLMADRQTTGGYPKIAVVIAADLHLAGQLLPGDSLRFITSTLEEAKAALDAQWNAIAQALPPSS